MLLCTEELLENDPEVLREEAGRFDHLLVDEYQDTNGSQYRIVKALASPHRNLCVVGDDDQSIYGWRGAEVQHILGFQRDWPDAKIVRLEENYRSTAAILAMANRLIAFNGKRHAQSVARRALEERPPASNNTGTRRPSPRPWRPTFRPGCDAEVGNRATSRFSAAPTNSHAAF